MKRWLLCFFMLVAHLQTNAQAYISMPSDSATWRDRIYDEDFLTQVFDVIVYVKEGEDTIRDGKTYHKLYSRAHRQVVPNGTVPPVTPVTATTPDTYYGAYRESDKKVYYLFLSGEKLIYDFTVSVGDVIPAHIGFDTVTSIDSVLLGGVYHKRYLTNEPDYWVIEGVGSSRGLLPELNDGSGNVTFMCFDHPSASVNYTPLLSVPCTYVYPWYYELDVRTAFPNSVGNPISISPIPAYNKVHVAFLSAREHRVIITDLTGRRMWEGGVNGSVDIDVEKWPRGIFCVLTVGNDGFLMTNKLMLE